MSRENQQDLTPQLTPRWQMDCTCRDGKSCDSCDAYSDLGAIRLEMADAILAYGRNPSMADRKTVAEHDEVLRMAREIQEIADR
jgi:hypothetical protein